MVLQIIIQTGLAKVKMRLECILFENECLSLKKTGTSVLADNFLRVVIVYIFIYSSTLILSREEFLLCAIKCKLYFSSVIEAIHLVDVTVGDNSQYLIELNHLTLTCDLWVFFNNNN